MEAWKYFEGTLKVYSEDKSIYSTLTQIGKESASYFDVSGKLIGKDFIIPSSKLEFVKRIVHKNMEVKEHGSTKKTAKNKLLFHNNL